LRANTRAHLALKADRNALRVPLSRWIFTTLTDSRQTVGFLALLPESPPAEPDVTEQLRDAQRRWRLTARQASVLALLVRGLTNETIADALGIAERTVEFHVSRILDKAGAHNRSTLIASVMTPTR